MSRKDAGFSGFSLQALTGAIAAGAGADSEVLQFRWVPTTPGKLARITEISLTGMRATTAFAVGAIDLKLTAARAWTADGTGGTALTLTTNNQKLRTAMSGTQAAIRVATTAALGAGTKVLDGNDLDGITAHSSGGFSAATPIIGAIYLPRTDLLLADEEAEAPGLTLANQEGFVLRATVPATGVWNLGVRIRWVEGMGF